MIEPVPTTAPDEAEHQQTLTALAQARRETVALNAMCREYEYTIRALRNELAKTKVLLSRAVSGDALAVRNKLILKALKEFDIAVGNMTQEEAREALGDRKACDDD